MSDTSSPWSAVVLHHGITLALCVVLFAAGVWGYLRYSDGALLAPGAVERAKEGNEGGGAGRYHMAAKRARIEQALGAYHLSRRTYPSSLAQLIQDDFLPQGALASPVAGLRFGMEEQGDTIHVVILEDAVALK